MAHKILRPPHIKQTTHGAQLIVQGEPWLVLGGEVHNSSCSCMEYFQTHVLDQAKETNVNTLLLPLYWEMIEPSEGTYDFTTIETLLPMVRKSGMKLIFLWFGLWKNGLSTYVPAWMKQDRQRFPFARKADGTPLLSITPFCQAAIEKDASAFAQVMKTIKALDAETQTVIMMQVENEMGLLESDRDYSKLANDAWIKNEGKQSEDVFMAIAYAKAVEHIAASGKAMYDLPMFVNAWLKKDQEQPGKYPSGGPHQDHISIYQTHAPSISCFAPDLYIEEIVDVLNKFDTGVLCIPETRQDPRVVSYGMYAFGAHPMICFAPFGIEDIWQEQEEHRSQSIYDMLGIQKAAFQPAGTLPLLEAFYEDMHNIQHKWVEWQEQGCITAFIQHGKEQHARIQIANQTFQIYYLHAEGNDCGAGWIIKEEQQCYLYLRNCAILLEPAQKQAVLRLEEGKFYHNEWQRGRLLNGDEQYQIIAGPMPKSFRLMTFSMEPEERNSIC